MWTYLAADRRPCRPEKSRVSSCMTSFERDPGATKCDSRHSTSRARIDVCASARFAERCATFCRMRDAAHAATRRRACEARCRERALRRLACATRIRRAPTAGADVLAESRPNRRCRMASNHAFRYDRVRPRSSQPVMFTFSRRHSHEREHRRPRACAQEEHASAYRTETIISKLCALPRRAH